MIEGQIFKLRSRNLLYGVYNGQGGYIGIREKFDSRFLATEYETATPLEYVGALPENIETSEYSEGVHNSALFDYLDALENPKQ